VDSYIRVLAGCPDAPYEQRVNGSLAEPVPGRRSVAHIHDHDAVSWLRAHEEARDAGLPIVTTIHNHAPYCPSNSRFRQRLGRPCDRHLGMVGCALSRPLLRCGRRAPGAIIGEYRRARRQLDVLRRGDVFVVTPSEFIRGQLVRHGVPAGRVRALPIPVANDRHRSPAPPPGDRPRLLFIGRLSADKGILWLLRALALVDPRISLDVAGAGDEEVRAKQFIARRGLNERVRMHGWVDGDRVTELLHQCWAVVVPSQWHEPGGTAVTEGQIAGRAVIAAAVGGLPEIAIDGETGLLVEPGDVLGLAHAISRVMRDRELREHIAERGRALALRRHARNRVVDELHTIYQREADHGP
jgi:glycosyltransferase involved in cell wall biosynthesis